MSAHIGRQMSDGNQDVIRREREEEKTHGSYFLISVPIKDPLCALGPGSCPDGPVAWRGESGPGKLGRRGGEEEVTERGHKQDHYDSDYSAHMHY